MTKDRDRTYEALRRRIDEQEAAWQAIDEENRLLLERVTRWLERMRSGRKR